MTLTIGLNAGEPSGDLLGAGLMRALRARVPAVAFHGIGGDAMLAEGLEPLGAMDRFAINGFVEPFRRFGELLGILRRLEAHFVANPPDAFIGIDFNVFNLLLARRLKRHGIPTLQYVSPSVYAWRRGRIRRIGRAVDAVMTLYPFEPALYRERGVRAEFVGHPMADDITPVRDPTAARRELGIPLDATVIALLPGSRRSEVELMAATMLATAALIANELPRCVFVVPCVSVSILERMDEHVRRFSRALDVRLVEGHARLPLAAADGALVKSGTGTLEAMLLRKPMVVTYRLPTLSYHLVKSLKRSEFVALPNILAGRLLVPELLQDAAEPAALARALLTEMKRAEAPGYYDEFARLHDELRCGGSQRAADVVLDVAGRAR
jgi:lipid-A-disaccharide synthase